MTSSVERVVLITLSKISGVPFSLGACYSMYYYLSLFVYYFSSVHLSHY